MSSASDVSKNIELIRDHSGRIEHLLAAKFGATGRGLHEKVSSVEGKINSAHVKTLRWLATIRNKTMHEPGYMLNDVSEFVGESDRIIKELTNYDLPTQEEPKSEPLTNRLKKKITEAIHPSTGVSPKTTSIKISETAKDLARNLVWVFAGCILLSTLSIGLIVGYLLYGIGGGILGGIIAGGIGYLLFDVVKGVGYELVDLVSAHFRVILIVTVILFLIIVFWQVKPDLTTVSKDVVQSEAVKNTHSRR